VTTSHVPNKEDKDFHEAAQDPGYARHGHLMLAVLLGHIVSKRRNKFKIFFIIL